MTKTNALRAPAIHQPGMVGLPHASLTETKPAVQRAAADSTAAPGMGHNFAQISVLAAPDASGVQRDPDPGAPGGSTVADLAAMGIDVSPGFLHIGGVTQTDTIIANAVIGTSYTPGVGNLM